MEQRSFGDGVCVSVLGIGCGRVGSISNPVRMREIELRPQSQLGQPLRIRPTFTSSWSRPRRRREASNASRRSRAEK
jgi:hypothetical protein